MKSPDEKDLIAVIGMSLRVPGSADLDTFWDRLMDGVESVTRFSEEELREAGIPDSVLDDPHYIRVKPVLEDLAEFDAAFFGLTPREAQVRDPQHRLFLESAYTALEHAGYDPFHCPGAVGVYGGGAPNLYREWNLNSHPEASAFLGEVGVAVANATDYLTTAVSHVLGLTGPSVNIVTACSTSLVAVHMACQALRAGECDAAVAGGVQVELPRKTGYHASEGGMFSLTGRVRPFDAGADGTIFGTGAGTVVLKRYGDALAAGDRVHAVVRVSAVNNDGALKSGFTAPSVEGQAMLIRQAMTAAGLDPEHIGYVEAHGTGTRVGDPVEVNALTRAYRDLGMSSVRSCPIGSVKGNVGHLGPAAGIVGLIKAVLALKSGRIPPSINYTTPNPEIDFEGGPFYVNTEPAAWPAGRPTRLAAVSSFGVGGTNAHVVVGQSPSRTVTGLGGDGESAPRRPVVLPLSARTPQALAQTAGRLAAHLEAHPGDADGRLGDVAATLGRGRPLFRYRAAIVPGEEGATAALRAARAPAAAARSVPADGAPVAFLFPGQGSQHLGMGRRLYDQEPVFRAAMDECAELARPLLEADLREAVFAGTGPDAAHGRDAADSQDAAARLTRTSMAQPALFAVEYALARLLMSWGITPRAMAGHSVGEYVAACLAGVFTLPDAVHLVARRGALVQELPGGSMLAVSAPAEEAAGLPGTDIAAYNGARLTVLSGPHEAIDAAEATLAARGVRGHRLHTSHAFHSAMMEPALDDFAAEVAKVELHAPALPFLSNVTGEWITDEQATDPAYWSGHLRAPVRYAPGIARLLEDPDLLFVEAGPGQVLTGLTRAQAVAAGERTRTIVPAMPVPQGAEDGPLCLARAVAALWAAGAPLDPGAYWDGDWQRIPLPTYPFQRTAHWLDPVAPPAPRPGQTSHEERPEASWEAAEEPGRRPIERALFRPEWREDTCPSPGTVPQAATWLLFRRGDILDPVISALRSGGAQVVTVEPGDRFERLTGSRYVLRPGHREDYDALAASLVTDGLTPQRVLHGWLTGPPDGHSAADDTARWLDLGFHSVLCLAQAWAGHSSLAVPGTRWDIVGSRLRPVTGAERIEPARAAVTGVCDVMAKELPEIAVRCVDVSEDRFVQGLLAELARAGEPAPAFAACGDRWVAMRGRRRWLLSWSQVPEPHTLDGAGPLRERGTYLVTGGLGGIGLTVAEALAKAVRARLVLTARSAFPPREDWDRLLAEAGTADCPGPSPDLLETVRWLRRIEGYGAEVLVCRADVADEDAMRAVVARGEREFGPIDGVFHAAGVPGGGLLALKTRSEAERVMSAKVAGTLVLDRLLGERVELMVLCSSIVSVAGNLGQTDYAAANAFMDAYAHARSADGPGLTVSVNWDAWAEVGMAAHADTLAPAAFRALQTGAVPAQTASRTSSADDPPPAPTDGPAPVHPLLGRRTGRPDGTVTYRTVADGDTHWVSAEYQVAGTPLWPATAYLEMARAAGADALADTLGQDGALLLTDVTFPHVLPLVRQRTLRTTLAPERGGFRFAIASAGPGQEWTEHATGRLRAAPGDRPQVQDLEVLRECFPVVKPDTGSFQPEAGLIDFGPRWANMAEIRRDDSSALARIELPAPFVPDLSDYRLHPALFDAATSNAVHLPELGATGESYLPFSIAGITVRGPLPPTVYAYARRRGTHQNTVTFDITVTDDEGREVADVVGYTVRVWDPEDFRRALRRVVEEWSDATVADRPAEPVAEPEDTAGAQGLGGAFAIRPEEGVQALWHILSDRLGPQIVVVPEGMEARLRSVERLTQDVIADAGQLPAARPSAAPPRAARSRATTPAAVPAATVHERLARLWSEALGIDGIDVDDDFFALGGNSLVGVQLAARVRREFDTDLPIATLIENPTVRAIAEIITT